MSVNQHNYILVGVKLDPNKVLTERIIESESFELLSWDSQHQAGKLAYIYDRMNGDYFIVGVPIHIDHYAENGLPLFEYEPDNFDYVMYAHEVKEHIKRKFVAGEVKPKLIVLTHYT